MKKNYSTPKIYMGGISHVGNKISRKEKEEALSKEWYVYYRFRDRASGELKRMPNIKAGANRIKNFDDRLRYLQTLRDTLELLLERGGDPTGNNDIDLLLGTKPELVPQVTKDAKPDSLPTVLPATKQSVQNDAMPIDAAVTFALNIKKRSISENSYRNFELRIRRFVKTLDKTLPITSITKTTVNSYLNHVLEHTSARNRNNTRTDLSSLFQVLEDNEIIAENFIKKISVLKSKPERNKTFTPSLEQSIFSYLEQEDPLLLLFIKFVSYNFLRPVEVCRLKIKDVDILDKKLYLRAKNKLVKIKIIPDLLLEELPALAKLPSENYLFTPTGLGDTWLASENNRRDHFSKRFKEIKDHFNLGADYGLYSFRHTYITKLYRKLRESSTQFETKSRLMLITGHSTMTALDQYLRDIDAELPEDYSNLLR